MTNIFLIIISRIKIIDIFVEIMYYPKYLKIFIVHQFILLANKFIFNFYYFFTLIHAKSVSVNNSFFR